ncbi:FimD/PapC N-terminal domain-containing protein [Morganella morganii]
MVIIKNGYADEFFNPAFLSDNGNEVADLSRFDKGLGQAAGEYRVEVFLNGEYVATQDILFVSNDKEGEIKPGIDDTGLIPCLTTDWFKKYNIDTSNAVLLNDSCVDFHSTYDKSQARFDFEEQKLRVDIPQASFINNIRGYIPPSEWQEGINALLLNYGFTGSHSKNTKNDERYNNYGAVLDKV